MKKKLSNCQGFTIVELLVSVSLTALLIVTVGSFFLNHLRSYHQAVEDISVQDQAKAAVNLFIEQAMETKGFTSLSALSAPGDNPYIVKLERVQSKEDPANTHFLIFSYDKTIPQLKWGIDNATNIVAGKITAFQVSYDSAKPKMAGVKIEVTGTDTGIPGPPEKITLENSLRFRNYTP